MSCPGSGARPDQTEASAKRPTPEANVRRRPRWSPSEPPTRTSAANTSVYASTTHCAPTAVAPRLFCTAGSTTATAVSSMNAMLEPRTVAARTHGPALRTQGASAFVDLMNSSSQGCLIALLIGPSTVPTEEPALATRHLPALWKQPGYESE